MCGLWENFAQVGKGSGGPNNSQGDANKEGGDISPKKHNHVSLIAYLELFEVLLSCKCVMLFLHIFDIINILFISMV